MKHTTWFTLDRFDGETPEAEQDATTDENKVDEPDETPEPEEPQGDAKPKPKPSETVEYWKRKSRENEQRAKANADKAKKLDEMEAANQTEAEKQAAKLEAAENRAGQLLSRAITAEVKALAADSFADPSDAADLLGRDTSKYVTDTGDIDTEGIADALADLLERKPHWAKPKAEPPKPRAPKPDPSQGHRGDDAPTDFRTADDKAVKAELDKLGIRLRS